MTKYLVWAESPEIGSEVEASNPSEAAKKWASESPQLEKEITVEVAEADVNIRVGDIPRIHSMLDITTVELTPITKTVYEYSVMEVEKDNAVEEKAKEEENENSVSEHTFKVGDTVRVKRSMVGLSRTMIRRQHEGILGEIIDMCGQYSGFCRVHWSDVSTAITTLLDQIEPVPRKSSDAIEFGTCVRVRQDYQPSDGEYSTIQTSNMLIRRINGTLGLVVDMSGRDISSLVEVKWDDTIKDSVMLRHIEPVN